MPSVIGTNSSANDSNSVSSITFPHTVPTSNSDRCLVVGAFGRRNDNTGVMSATYNGVAMNKVGEAHSTGEAVHAALFELANPATGANNVVVSYAASSRAVAGAFTLADTDQGTPSRNAATASGNSTAPSVTITSAAGDLVVDAVCNQDDTRTLTVHGSQTQQFQDVESTGTPSQGMRGAGSTEAGAASVAMDWTLNLAEDWAIVGASFQPPTGRGFPLWFRSVFTPWQLLLGWPLAWIFKRRMENMK